MTSLNLHLDQADDQGFAEIVTQIVTGAVVTHKPLEVYIFKIDHWFDHKWLGFSGKFLGAVGSWRKPLTVPPFVANRIIDQWHYCIDKGGGRYVSEATDDDVHYRGPSRDNLFRRLEQVAPNSALFWYSGDASETGRGSLMGYIPLERDYWTWFIALELKDDWRIARRKNIHEYEVRLFREADAASRIAPLASESSRES